MSRGIYSTIYNISGSIWPKFLILGVFLLKSLQAHGAFELKNEPILQRNLSVKSFLVVNQIHSIEQYAIWLNKNIVYKSDEGKDTWANPEETIKKGFGDCEDLAFLTAEVLKIFGYQPKVLAAGKKSEAHVFTIFQKDGFYQIFDNLLYYTPNAPSIEYIFKHLHKIEKAEYLIEISLYPKDAKLLFSKKLP